MDLPVRIVNAAQEKIEEAAVARYSTALGIESVEGFPHDFAKASAGAVIDVLADALADTIHDGCRSGPRCVTCLVINADVEYLRGQAQRVRDVPPVEEV